MPAPTKLGIGLKTASKATLLRSGIGVRDVLRPSHCGSAEMSALVKSRLISASMQRVFGRSGPEIVSAATSTPAQANMPAGSPWLAAILGTANLTVVKGSVVIEHEDRYASILAHSALVRARAACYAVD